MLTFRPATPDQYDDFLRVLKTEAAEYLAATLRHMGMTKDEFAHIFRTVGEVRGIYEGEDLAGFYWIEKRQEVLHLHALILKRPSQGRGLGAGALGHHATPILVNATAPAGPGRSPRSFEFPCRGSGSGSTYRTLGPGRCTNGTGSRSSRRSRTS